MKDIADGRHVSATEALTKLNGTIIDGRKLAIRYSEKNGLKPVRHPQDTFRLPGQDAKTNDKRAGASSAASKPTTDEAKPSRTEVSAFILRLAGKVTHTLIRIQNACANYKIGMRRPRNAHETQSKKTLPQFLL